MLKDDLKERVFDHLPKGKENAITGRELAYQLGEKGTRRVRLCIEQLRKEHRGICSSNHEPYGYYKPASREEFDETIKVLRFGYLVEINQRIHDLEAARDAMFPQLGMRL